MLLNEYLRDRFGHKVYKVAINGGFTCPNRDGTLDSRGCIFCSGRGSGEFSCDSSVSVTDQIENGIKRIEKKLPSGEVGYIAYFQAFTNTYAPVSKLERLYMEAISDPRIEVLSVATRPDCISNEALKLLEEINKVKPVWVELGLQTIHEKSASYIRRGYKLPVYDEAVKRLSNSGIEVITHVILGLPGENKEMMLRTARFISESGSDGIKLQLLHILRGTVLEKMYEKGEISELSEAEYIDLVCSIISELPPETVIHRLTGDGDKNKLIAPLWSCDKRKVLNHINHELKQRGIIQGNAQKHE